MFRKTKQNQCVFPKVWLLPWKQLGLYEQPGKLRQSPTLPVVHLSQSLSAWQRQRRKARYVSVSILRGQRERGRVKSTYSDSEPHLWKHRCKCNKKFPSATAARRLLHTELRKMCASVPWTTPSVLIFYCSVLDWFLFWLGAKAFSVDLTNLWSAEGNLMQEISRGWWFCPGLFLGGHPELPQEGWTVRHN